MEIELIPPPLPDEPTRWYLRFAEYCVEGTSRSLEAVWRTTAKGGKRQRPPGSWYRASNEWEWKKRAAQFDRNVFADRAGDLQLMAERERARRRTIISEIGKRIEQLLSRDRIGMSSAEIAMLRTYLDASVKEFGPTRIDAPQPVSEPLSPGRIGGDNEAVNERTGEQVG